MSFNNILAKYQRIKNLIFGFIRTCLGLSSPKFLDFYVSLISLSIASPKRRHIQTHRQRGTFFISIDVILHFFYLACKAFPIFILLYKYGLYQYVINQKCNAVNILKHIIQIITEKLTLMIKQIIIKNVSEILESFTWFDV